MVNGQSINDVRQFQPRLTDRRERRAGVQKNIARFCRPMQTDQRFRLDKRPFGIGRERRLRRSGKQQCVFIFLRCKKRERMRPRRFRIRRLSITRPRLAEIMNGAGRKGDPAIRTHFREGMVRRAPFLGQRETRRRQRDRQISCKGVNDDPHQHGDGRTLFEAPAPDAGSLAPANLQVARQ